MTKWHHSSSTSASCRLEWRPSRLLLAALVSLTLLAAFSVVVSGVPRLLAWPLLAWVVWFGIRGARSQSRRPTIQLMFPGNGMPAIVDGEAVEGMRIEWRGPLAFATWKERGGGVRRLVWWPDILPATKRRELRLAASDSEAARQRS